jgi:hypothetical protein
MDDSVCPKYFDNRSEERTETKFIFAFGEERFVLDEIGGRERCRDGVRGVEQCNAE